MSPKKDKKIKKATKATTKAVKIASPQKVKQLTMKFVGLVKTLTRANSKFEKTIAKQSVAAQRATAKLEKSLAKAEGRINVKHDRFANRLELTIAKLSKKLKAAGVDSDELVPAEKTSKKSKKASKAAPVVKAAKKITAKKKSKKVKPVDDIEDVTADDE